MRAAEILHQITTALEQARVPYMVVGSFASNLYGTGRSTYDIDVVISAEPEQIRVLLSTLPTDKYYFNLNAALEACRQKDMFNILEMEQGWKIDLIFEKPSAYHQQAFQRRASAEIENIPLFAATAEDTIIAKLDWARMGESSRQIEDVAGILKVSGPSLDRSYIDKWVQQLGLVEQWTAACRIGGFD